MTEKPKKKRKVRKMDVILVALAVVGFFFTREMIEVYRETGGVPDSLVVGVFGVLGGECGFMALIKNTEERKQDREWQLQDREREENRQDQKPKEDA